MLWVWSCSVSTEELFLKMAVPKRQAKSLKSNYEVVSFYYICKPYTWNLWRKIFSQVFFKDFAKAFLKDFADFPLYGIVKDLIIFFAEAFRYFSHYQFTMLLHFFIKILDQLFLRNTFVSANTCLKVITKKHSSFWNNL